MVTGAVSGGAMSVDIAKSMTRNMGYEVTPEVTVEISVPS
jgi:hypothetical protein